MKVRIIGVLLLVVGFFMISYIDHETVDIFSGIIIGVGLGFSITGRFKKRKTFFK